ncbi:MAG: hypothetical protein JXA20_10000 [Spirochaetes bacterium]|nr:hypothetical protein [Spirochaetota bacterium]
MKKTGLIAILTAVLVPVSLAAQTIAEYYNQIEHDRIVRKGAAWEFAVQPDYGSREVRVVDLRNGYLQTLQHGGDGDVETIYVLYLDAGRNPYVGITTCYNGTGGDYTVLFMAREKGKWVNVTARVLPKIDHRMFLDPAFVPSKMERFMESADYRSRGVKLVQYAYALPRHGTTASVSLHVKDPEMFVGGEDRETVKEFKSRIVYKRIELVWDGKNGRFTTGKRLR